MATKPQPKVLDEPKHRDMARAMRDNQWRALERIAEHNPLYICWWDKQRRHPKDDGELPPDLLVCGLINGMELAAWLRAHPEWTETGEWSDERYATPVWITDAGREALSNRELYDMEPVEGGMVEPGWVAVPAERTS